MVKHANDVMAFQRYSNGTMTMMVDVGVFLQLQQLSKVEEPAPQGRDTTIGQEKNATAVQHPYLNSEHLSNSQYSRYFIVVSHGIHQ